MAYALLDSSRLSWTGQPRLLHLAVTATNGEIKSARINEQHGVGVGEATGSNYLLNQLSCRSYHCYNSSVCTCVYICRHEFPQSRRKIQPGMTCSRGVGRMQHAKVTRFLNGESRRSSFHDSFLRRAVRLHLFTYNNHLILCTQGGQQL
jgi:hypothetical protein